MGPSIFSYIHMMSHVVLIGTRLAFPTPRRPRLPLHTNIDSKFNDIISRRHIAITDHDTSTSHTFSTVFLILHFYASLTTPTFKMATMETPRVSCPYLNSYVNRNVLIVGKVVQLRGESAIVDADGHVTVNLNRVRYSAFFCLSLSFYFYIVEHQHANCT